MRVGTRVKPQAAAPLLLQSEEKKHGVRGPSRSAVVSPCIF